MSAMNANALFIGSNSSDSYHQAIQLPEEIKRVLRNADKEIRVTVRQAANLVTQAGKEMSLATNKYREARQEPLSLEVRFLRQGGTVYKTDINPAHLPPQQSDLDDGIYVKTSFLSHDEPGLASRKLFKLVEEALRPLCERKGWRLEKKNTCIRVELDNTKHIDLPLYAIPDEEFISLKESLRDASGYSMDMACSNMQNILERHKNLRIPTDRVMLAHREFGWVHSDPRALHDWFEEQFNRYGPQLRRQCRYLKGWRDFFFSSGGPSSVTLMVCAANTYRLGKIKAEDDRDDLAFMHITENLPEMFNREITNPVLSDAPSLNDWDDLERQQFVNATQTLHSHVDGALNGHYIVDITVERLQKALGERVPNRPDLVKAFPKSFEIKRQNVVTSALPQVRRTTSG